VVDGSGDGRLAFGEGEAVGQEDLMRPPHYGSNVALLEVALRCPFPLLSPHCRHQHPHSSQHSLVLITFLLPPKSHQLIPRLVLAEVRIANEEGGHATGKSFVEEDCEFELAVELGSLYFDGNGKVH
jgi:hypothetical protein